MTLAILTKEELQNFKAELLEDIKKIVKAEDNTISKKWLKSKEVTKLLNISIGTLQNLRINGSLSYTKIGGTIYYDNTDIDKLLNTNKKNATPTIFK